MRNIDPNSPEMISAAKDNETAAKVAAHEHEQRLLDDAAAKLGEAMQDVWNDFCADTGCIPGFLTVHGPPTTRIEAEFTGSEFVREVVETLKMRERDVKV